MKKSGSTLVAVIIAIVLTALVVGGGLIYLDRLMEAKPEIEETAMNGGESGESTEEGVDITAPKEFAFDTCGTVPKYKNKPWYGDFIAKLKPQITATQFSNLDSGQTYTKSDACMALDESLFIALIPDTDYLSGDGSIFRFKPATGEFTKATRGTGFSGDGPGEPLHEFGTRIGDYVEAFGYLGDAGMAVQWDYRYFFKENRYDIVKHCSWEVDDKVGTIACDDTLLL